MCSAEVGEGPSEPFKGFHKLTVSFPATSLIILHISVLCCDHWDSRHEKDPSAYFNLYFCMKLWSQLKTSLCVFVSGRSAEFTWTKALAGNGSKDMLWSVRSMCKLNQIYSVHRASLGAVSVRIVNWAALHGHIVIPCWGLYRKHREENLKSISELSTVLGKE